MHVYDSKSHWSYLSEFKGLKLDNFKDVGLETVE